eukprot:1146259-Pelagomonas_calceolata.AAC.1
MLHGACASGADCAHCFAAQHAGKGSMAQVEPSIRPHAHARLDDRYVRLSLLRATWRTYALYALSIGLPNGGKGDWKEQIHGPFTHVMALSPGFMRPPFVGTVANWPERPVKNV